MKYLIKIIFENTSKLHVGAGTIAELPTQPEPIYRLFKSDDTFEIVIPGSSIKGVFRHFADKIAIQYNGENQETDEFTSCKTIVPDKMCKSCDVCDLFGAPGKTFTKVYFNDAISTLSFEDVHRVTGILIDRRRGTVKEQALFDYEVVPPFTEFSFTIEAYNLSERNWRLLITVIRSFEMEGLGKHHTPLRIKSIHISPEPPVYVKKMLEGIKFG